MENSAIGLESSSTKNHYGVKMNKFFAFVGAGLFACGLAFSAHAAENVDVATMVTQCDKYATDHWCDVHKQDSSNDSADSTESSPSDSDSTGNGDADK